MWRRWPQLLTTKCNFFLPMKCNYRIDTKLIFWDAVYCYIHSKSDTLVDIKDLFNDRRRETCHKPRATTLRFFKPQRYSIRNLLYIFLSSADAAKPATPHAARKELRREKSTKQSSAASLWSCFNNSLDTISKADLITGKSDLQLAYRIFFAQSNFNDRPVTTSSNQRSMSLWNV